VQIENAKIDKAVIGDIFPADAVGSLHIKFSMFSVCSPIYRESPRQVGGLWLNSRF